MKKHLIATLLVLFTFTLFGCASINKEVPEQSPDQSKPNQPIETVTEKFQPNLGGIKLGDSKDQVLKNFGTNYNETVYDEDYSLGEPFHKLAYPNGILVVVGSTSKKVLEIETTSSTTPTNLGFKVGDKAQDVLKEYRSKYKEPDSRHGYGKLIGWFLLHDQELVIFNFDQSDSLVNQDVKAEARIERIKLSNFNYMD